MNKPALQFLMLLLIGSASIRCEDPRTVQVITNPDCDQCGKPNNTTGSINNLVYVKSTGSNDTIHMLVSNIDSFTILLFKTELGANLTVNQTELLSHNASRMFEAITFSKPTQEAFGYSFPVIYEFNDIQGTADITTNGTQVVPHLTSDLVWKPFSQTSNTSGSFQASYPAKGYILNRFC